MKKFEKIGLFIFIILGIILLFIFIPEKSTSNNKTVSDKITTKEKSQQIKTVNKQMAIDSIKEYSNVQDAALSQKENKVSLVVIVDYATSNNKCKELGDNFVRLVKSFSSVYFFG